MIPRAKKEFRPVARFAGKKFECHCWSIPWAI